MNVFVIGYTKSGKTTVGSALADKLGMRSVSASGWIRSRVTSAVAADVGALTHASLQALAQDPDACVAWLRATHDVGAGGLVIDGIRNPRDFALLFRPERDVVLTIDASWAEHPATEFERLGLAVIQALLDFQVQQGLLSPMRRIHEAPAEHALPVLVHFAAEAIQALQKEPPSARRGVCNVEISPIAAWLDSRVLYNEDPKHAGWWQGCEIFAVSSYVGSPLTFQVLMANGGAMFSYVPPHRLRLHNVGMENPLDLEDLVYRNAPSPHIAVTTYETLGKAPCWVFLKRRKEWMQARYLMTVDWYTENDLDHVLALANGQIACLPSHKVLFGSEGPLPPYKALKATWSAPHDPEAAALTSACVVIEGEGGLVLGVSRKDNHADFGLPGGKLEPGELPEEAAARELYEETGLRVDPFTLRKVYVGTDRPGGPVAVAFVAKHVTGTPRRCEVAAVEWVTWEKLLAGTFGEYNAALKAALDAEKAR